MQRIHWELHSEFNWSSWGQVNWMLEKVLYKERPDALDASKKWNKCRKITLHILFFWKSKYSLSGILKICGGKLDETCHLSSYLYGMYLILAWSNRDSCQQKYIMFHSVIILSNWASKANHQHSSVHQIKSVAFALFQRLGSMTYADVSN